MRDDEDLGDSRSRERNRRRLDDARRTIAVGGKWRVVHPFRASRSETVLAWIGAAILIGFGVAFVVAYLRGR